MLCMSILGQVLCDFSFFLYCVHYCDDEVSVVVFVCLSVCLDLIVFCLCGEMYFVICNFDVFNLYVFL